MKNGLGFLYYYFFSLNLFGIKILYLINPFSVFARIKFRHDPKRLDDYKKSYFSTFDNPRKGIGDYIAFGGVFITLFLLIDGLSLIFLGLINFTIEPDYILFASVLVITYISIQLLIFKNDLYIEYFEKFKKRNNTFGYVYATLFILLSLYLEVIGLKIYSR